MIGLTEARKLQNERKATAIKLLDHFDFQSIFNRYGDYVIRGSLAHNLMLKPDIDGTIFVAKLDIDQILSLVNELVRTPGVMSVTIENRALIQESGEHNKKGWVIRMKVPFEGLKWNFDVHILKHEDAAGHDYLGEHIYSAAQYDAMLLIKAQLTEMRRYPGSSKIPGSFASVDVYRAVIEDGISTTNDLLAWGETHDYYGKG